MKNPGPERVLDFPWILSTIPNQRRETMLSNSQTEDLQWQRGWYSKSSEFEDYPEENSGAEVPVPDRLLPKRQSQALLLRLRLSQKIGLLMWMNKKGLLSKGGEQRLLYLQRNASIEAISAGLKFVIRLTDESKLQSDFFPHMVELNRRPQSKHFRRTEKARIGIGYRDKGTLPDKSSLGRTLAQKESWIAMSSLPENLQLELQCRVPHLIEGEWLNLGDISNYFDSLKDLRDQLLLNQL